MAADGWKPCIRFPRDRFVIRNYAKKVTIFYDFRNQ